MKSISISMHSLFAEKLKLLKKSLSEALTRLYPLEGKVDYNASISCNDHGAAFLEDQANLFECGGSAVGGSNLHKVADASTFSTLIKHWAELALSSASNSDHAVLSHKIS
ncbi:hypothetical protein ACFXTI_007032 [Malus domestica]